MALLLAVVLGFVVVAASPLKQLIPGYLADSQRAATEEAIMRIDSLREAYAINEQYINNVRNILDNSARLKDIDSIIPDRELNLSVDSLLLRSDVESRFISSMQEREKFNVGMRAAIAAEDIILYPVSAEGIVSQDSRDSFAARVILPVNSSVMAIADGRIIAAYYDGKLRNYVVMIQHDRGFVSRISGLSRPDVGEGDEILGGEVIAALPSPNNRSSAEISVEIWYDGVPVKPYDYVAGRRSLRSSSSIPN